MREGEAAGDLHGGAVLPATEACHEPQRHGRGGGEAPGEAPRRVSCGL